MTTNVRVLGLAIVSAIAFAIGLSLAGAGSTGFGGWFSYVWLVAFALYGAWRLR